MNLALLASYDVEIFLTLFACVLLVISSGGLINNNAFRAFSTLTATVLVLALPLCIMDAGLFIRDVTMAHGQEYSLINFVKFLAVGVTVVLGSYFSSYLYQIDTLKGEPFVLLILSIVGMFVMVSAQSLLTMYVGLELMSFSIYILTALNRDHVRSSEASLKYFLLGSLSSCLLLFGLSFLYAVSGSLSFDVVGTALSGAGGDNKLVLLGVFFVMVSVLFKFSAVPFHMWTPDVYEGAPIPVVAYMATIGKIAVAILALRLVFDVFFDVVVHFKEIFLVLSAMTMLLGSFLAVLQNSIKRLLAYSTITHMGFVLAALFVMDDSGVSAYLFYLVSYVLTSLALFGVFTLLKYRGVYFEQVSDLAGLGIKEPILSVIFAICFFSLAGIPPFVGFFAKLSVFAVLLGQEYYFVIAAGVLSSLVALYYSLRIVKVMFFDQPKFGSLQIDNPKHHQIVYNLSIILGGLVLFFGIFPSKLAYLLPTIAYLN